MPVVIVDENGEGAKELNGSAEDVYTLLQNKYKLSPANIAALAIDKQCAGWMLQENNLPPKENKSYCFVTSSIATNNDLRLPGDVRNYVSVCSETDDVLRVNTQLYNMAAAFAYTVLQNLLNNVDCNVYVWDKQLSEIAYTETDKVHYISAQLFWGSREVMRKLCLTVVESWPALLQPFLIAKEHDATIRRSVASKSLRAVKSDPRQVVLFANSLAYSADNVLRKAIEANCFEIAPRALPLVVKKDDTCINHNNTRAFVINLDEHPDRLSLTLIELQRIEPIINTVERVQAIKCTPGSQGCRLSHIKTLTKAINECSSDIQQIAIFEDDFMWCKWCEDPLADITKSIPTGLEYDVILLNFSPRPGWKRIEQAGPNLLRLFDTYSTAGYIVHRRFWQTLRDHWLVNTDKDCDLSWQELQNTHLFYGVAPCMSNQRPLQSSITNSPKPGEPQITLIFPPNPDSSTQLVRTMFSSVIVKGRDARLRAAKDAISTGDFDCSIIVETLPCSDARTLVGILNAIIDRLLGQEKVTDIPNGIAAYRRRGVNTKFFWKRRSFFPFNNNFSL